MQRHRRHWGSAMLETLLVVIVTAFVLLETASLIRVAVAHVRAEQWAHRVVNLPAEGGPVKVRQRLQGMLAPFGFHCRRDKTENVCRRADGWMVRRREGAIRRPVSVVRRFPDGTSVTARGARFELPGMIDMGAVLTRAVREGAH